MKKCSKLLQQTKMAKLQWLQNPSPTNGDKLNNVKYESSQCFMFINIILY
jgi:hypothetical protein